MGRIVNNIRNHLTIISNFSYLSLLQAFNLFLPLIVYPYLTKVLGVEKYGEIVFAQSIAFYFSVIINYGFNMYGTNAVAVSVKRKRAISEIVSSIYYIKFILWIVSLFSMLLLLYFIQSLRNEFLLYFITFFITFNELLFPQWFYLGIEKLKIPTIINITIRSLFILLVFIFVKAKDDYLLVPLLNSLGVLCGGIIGTYIVLFKLNVRMVKRSMSDLLIVVKNSFPLFASSVSIQIYNNSSKVIVGSFLGMSDVAYFDLGQKILRVLKIPLRIISQVIYPKISRDKNYRLLNNLAIILLLITSFIYILIFYYSQAIVFLITSEEFYPAIEVVRILCLSFILVGVNQFFGSLRLVPFGYSKELAKVTIITLFIYIIFVIIMYFFGIITLIYLSWVSVMIDLITLVWLFLISYKRKII